MTINYLAMILEINREAGVLQKKYDFLDKGS